MTEGIEQLIAFHCAPTLMGCKAANLFSLKREAYRAQEEEILRLTAMLVEKGLSAQIFHGPGDATLMYLYRKDMLLRQLHHPASRELLASHGYTGDGVDDLVAQLKKRVEQSDTFPHEIGLFLGYPPEDVKGFVKHKGASCKLCGCWKVYGDVGKARALFGQYAHCRTTCCTYLQSGMTLDQLVQAV